MDNGNGGDLNLGLPPEPLQLDRESAHLVMVREEAAPSSREHPLITSGTPGYAKTAWRYFAQYLAACREGGEDVDRLLSEAAAAQQQEQQAAAAAAAGQGDYDAGAAAAAAGGWKPVPPALVQHSSSAGSHASSYGSGGNGGQHHNKRKRAASADAASYGRTSSRQQQPQGGSGMRVAAAVAAANSWAAAFGAEAREAFDDWVEANSTAGADPASRAALLETAGWLVSEALRKRGGTLGQPLALTELAPFVSRHGKAMEGVVAQAAAAVPAARPALECLVQFAEEAAAAAAARLGGGGAPAGGVG